MRRQSPGKSVLVRLHKAQNTRDWGEVAAILDEATTSEAKTIKPVLPELITHHNWLVRTSAVEMAGGFRQKEFVSLVKARLRDTNKIVRSYALQAYYDLLGTRSLPTLRGFCGDKIVGIRVTALALCYVATRDKSFLDTLARILLRKYCKYHDRYVALHTLDYYLSISADDGVATMFKSILKATPRAQGLAKDIKKRLHEWGHKERHSRDRNA